MASLTHSIRILSMLAAASLSGGAALAGPDPEQLALQAAERWLSLTDAGKYDESYREASQYFQHAVSADQWQSSMHAVRDPLGKLIARKLRLSQFTEILPGAPDGKYVVLQYDTKFEHKQSAIETITTMLDSDGKWRVSGYFIK